MIGELFVIPLLAGLDKPNLKKTTWLHEINLFNLTVLPSYNVVLNY